MPKGVGGGRPTIPVDIDKLKAFLRLKPTLEDCAAFFDCSTSHIEKTAKRDTGLSFSALRDQSMVHTRFGLIRNAIQKANKGDNVMMIFCLKNLCGWKDKWDNDVENSKVVIEMAYNPKKGTLNGAVKRDDEAGAGEAETSGH